MGTGRGGASSARALCSPLAQLFSLARRLARRLAPPRSPSRRFAAWLGFAFLGTGLAVAAALAWGSVAVAPGEWLASLDPAHPLHVVVWGLRVPRVAAAATAGAALAVAGALLQTLVRNPLADPGLLGVNAGAGTAAVLVLVLAPERAALVPWVAFAGALAAVLALLAAARGATPLKLIVAGVAVQTVLFAVLAMLTFLFADRAPAFVSFTVGSFAGAGWEEVRWAAAVAGAGLALALGGRRAFDLLLLDDDSAGGVGLGVSRARVGAAALAAALAAAAVALGGLVGFVGLVVPNAVRLAAGPHHGRLLPLAALGGAGLTVAADLAARVVAAPVELPVGALLALLGGPYFFYLLRRKVT